MVSENYDFKLDSGWQFHLGELTPVDPDQRFPLSHVTTQAGGMLKEYDMFKYPMDWHEVNLPHDWCTELPYDVDAHPSRGYKEYGTAWYYNCFELPEKEIMNARLVFDGVLGKTTVYVNGILAGRNFSGYNRFSFEIGDYLIPGGKNEIVLHVDARRWEGWWYEGAGLYRPVRIEFRGDSFFDKENTLVMGKKTGENWEILVNIKAYSAESAETTVYDMDGKALWSGEIPVDEGFEIPVENPKLWSPEKPYLYNVAFKLSKNETIQDEIEFKTGLRSVEWVANEGMYLNGNPYRVKGICCHQDHAGVGAAVTREIVEYRISILKKLGINAYRCAHHAPDETLLEICDKMGMLVMAENRHFNASEEVMKQIDAMALISRNHPSVFIYSLFNEETLIQNEERGRRVAQKLKNRILSLDSTRAITGAQNGGHLTTKNASDALDVIGLNYSEKDYSEIHQRVPEKVLLGTENCPTYATRGVYHSDKEKRNFACYGDEWADTFSESLDETVENVEGKPYVAGFFAWSGFDYRGEPTPYDWPSVMSHWGFTDECGFAKDTAYHLMAYYSDELMVHLLPHWNWKKGEIVRVCAFTNGDYAELFVNGKSVGEEKVTKRRAEWNVPFEEGTIKVVAKRGGLQVTDAVQTAGKPFEIKLEDASSSQNVHIINASVVDESGIMIPDFCEKVSFDIPKGALLGVGNGNPNSHHDEKGTEINFFNGRAQIIVRGGEGKLVANCNGIKSAEMEL